MVEVKKVLALIILISLISCSLVCNLFHEPELMNMQIFRQSGTRANDTVNYTQLCLDFYNLEYGADNNTVASSSLRTTVETGVNYSIVVIRHTLEDGRINHTIVSVNHETQHIEFGDRQIQRDYQEYVANLPRPYPKTDQYTRQLLLFHFSELPSIDDAKDLDYVCIVYFSANISDYEELMDGLNNSGYSVNRTEMYDYAVIVSVDNVSLHDYLRIADENYVIHGSLVNIQPHDEEVSKSFILIFVGVILAVLIGGVLIMAIRMSKQ